MILARLLFQTVFLAIGQVWANKTRALLTALGIIIGVSSVIAVITSLSGMKGYVLSEIESFGARSMWIWGTVPADLDVRPAHGRPLLAR
ncbi:MAG: ABC transporter permease, partial [Planctomycetota bacterium]